MTASGSRQTLTLPRNCGLTDFILLSISFSCFHLHCAFYRGIISVLFMSLGFFYFFFPVNTGLFKAHTQTLSSYVLMYVRLVNMLLWKHERCPCWYEQVVWQIPCVTTPTLNNIKHLFSRCNRGRAWTQCFISRYLLSLTLSLALHPLSDTSFHLCSTSVTFSWSWQGAWGVWWAQLSPSCSYCCYTKAYSKNNTLLWPQPPRTWI